MRTAPFTQGQFVTATGNRDTRVGAVRKRLTEETSGMVLTAEGGPLGVLTDRGSLELRQHSSGLFPSSLHPGDWRGLTVVDVLYAGVRFETLHAEFAFR